MVSAGNFTFFAILLNNHVLMAHLNLEMRVIIELLCPEFIE